MIDALLFALLMTLSSAPVRPVSAAPPRAGRGPIPPGPAGDAIRRGRALVTDTYRRLPGHVGSRLACTNCHLDEGTKPDAAPWTGLAAAYPAYQARSGRWVGLAERINGCFLRSMNGRALPVDGRAMRAIVAYIDWLSPPGTHPRGRGLVPVAGARATDPVRGRVVYAARCAGCHGAEGQGRRTPAGDDVAPPLWGPEAFNVGAGMARTFTAAAFVRRNMPLGAQGTLSAQQAVDVAAYFTHLPRPAFAAAARDWPRGGRPPDARSGRP